MQHHQSVVGLNMRVGWTYRLGRKQGGRAGAGGGGVGGVWGGEIQSAEPAHPWPALPISAALRARVTMPV